MSQRWGRGPDEEGGSLTGVKLLLLSLLAPSSMSETGGSRKVSSVKQAAAEKSETGSRNVSRLKQAAVEKSAVSNRQQQKSLN